MSSKTKKGKKKTKVVSDVTKSKDNLANKKIYTLFTNEEITEIKSVLKIKDVKGVPILTAATILQKFDLLKKLAKDGYNINQTGQNNMTALMWAVKHKYLDIIDFLLVNGADPTIKTDSGDNILILALEHKLWDEQSTINLWKSIKRAGLIDINSTNKNGHNILHMCVRRDWEELLKLLLTEKPDVDAGNSNGVTPLMLASFRNNINIIDILIDAGADILKEDHHGRMTLCYAISSSMKISKPPFLAAEKIISELRKKSVIDTYLKRRLELIITTAKKSEVSCATSEMLIKIVQFAVHFIEEGARIFLECDVFTQLLEILDARLDKTDIVKFLLEVCEEILFYNEQSVGYKPDLHSKINESFFKSGLVQVALDIMQHRTEEATAAFNLLVLGFTAAECWEKLLEENSNAILPFLNEGQPSLQDEARVKILKGKKRKLKKVFENLEIVPIVQTDSEKFDDRKKNDSGINYSKKSRRRSKAIKAKLTKMKSAELSKRLNLSGKKLNQKRTLKLPSARNESFDKIEFILKPEENFQSENPIAASFQYLLNSEVESGDNKPEVEVSPKWKKQIIAMSHLELCKNLPVDEEKLSYCINHLKESSSCQKFDININRSINIVVDYLRHLIQMIARKYREHWENDKMTGNCNCVDLNEHVPWLFSRHLKTVENREKQVVQDLQKNFEQLLKSVKDLAHKDLKQCLKSIHRIESKILNYEIRGIKLISYVCGMEDFTMKYTTTNPKIDDENVVKYVERVVNNLEEPRQDVEIEIFDDCDDVSFTETYRSETPFELYYREMSLVGRVQPRNKRKEIEAKLNTIANGFHLINSTMSVCDEGDENHQKLYGISDLNHPLRNKYQKSLHCSEISEYMPKRLKSQISSLQNTKTFQKLLDGEIRIATKEQRLNYIISAGINFNAAELGLDINNQPLAVKRIPRESWVGKIIKTLVDPLLGLVDNHILHYFACEFEGNELIFATPLCKWTMAQYVQLLRQSSATTMPGLTAIQIVKQFLDGLMVLHKCEIPIVHGNLKPSNIFIDFNGLVKIAEFGIHKALYKIIEAPKSSLIWFAKETLDIYRNSSIVECSLKSDIQVAGMLTYFILTYGKHPFGDDTEEILKNIQRGIPKLNARNLDLRDLLLWMMLSDFNERPNIEQVLSHTFFWSPSKKWSFILCCAGINQSGYLLPINVEKLHRSIDSFCDSYIKIDWHEIMGNRFPAVRISEVNGVIGLLKFIKHCHDHRLETNITDADLSCAVLSLFPALPVGLYRTLQNTNWLKHAVFMQFSEVF